MFKGDQCSWNRSVGGRVMKIMVVKLGFPCSSVGKEFACSRRPGFDPWVGKIPWWRKWQPTKVSLPGKSHRQRSLVGCSPWGCKESGMTEQLTLTYLKLVGAKSHKSFQFRIFVFSLCSSRHSIVIYIRGCLSKLPLARCGGGGSVSLPKWEWRQATRSSGRTKVPRYVAEFILGIFIQIPTSTEFCCFNVVPIDIAKISTGCIWTAVDVCMNVACNVWSYFLLWEAIWLIAGLEILYATVWNRLHVRHITVSCTGILAID